MSFYLPGLSDIEDGDVKMSEEKSDFHKYCEGLDIDGFPLEEENAPTYPQAQENNEFRYLSPAWLDEIARGLTAGAQKYPGETWRTIPPKEHAWRAVRHLILYLKGDNGDTHLINASMRCMMAFVTAAAECDRGEWEKRMKEKGCG